jgi:hypothetical protein
MKAILALALCAMFTGCASGVIEQSNKATHGNLVDDWYENVEKSEYYGWTPYGPIQHMCKYEDGVIINIGRNVYCP